MIRFLNLFAAYRDAVSMRLVAESDARRERSRADRLETKVSELERELIDTHKGLNDKFGQRFLNTRFWSEAEVREPSEHTSIPIGRQHGRVAQAQAFEKFKADLTAWANGNDANGTGTN